MSRETVPVKNSLTFIQRVVPENIRNRALKNYFLILDKYDRGDEENTATCKDKSKEKVSSVTQHVDKSENGTQTVLTKASKGITNYCARKLTQNLLTLHRSLIYLQL